MYEIFNYRRNFYLKLNFLYATALKNQYKKNLAKLLKASKNSNTAHLYHSKTFPRWSFSYLEIFCRSAPKNKAIKANKGHAAPPRCAAYKKKFIVPKKASSPGNKRRDNFGIRRGIRKLQHFPPCYVSSPGVGGAMPSSCALRGWSHAFFCKEF